MTGGELTCSGEFCLTIRPIRWLRFEMSDMRCRMSIWVILLVVLAPAVIAHAQDSRRDQIAAANARAVDALLAQISQERVGRNVTVGDLLNKTNSTDTFVKTLQRAQQIGGPRWIDDQTCQVRLEISGQRVAQALISLAQSNAKKSPLAPELLTGRLRDW